MKLYNIISNLKFIGIKNYREVEIDSLTCSSAERVNNGIYFCIKGLKTDGHDYAYQSIKNGAVCLIVERFLDLPVPQILVENVRSAMSYISSIFYETNKSNIKFIGITGTNGKTTTTYIIKDILSRMGKKVGLIGTTGVYINKLLLPATLTTPDPIVLHKLISDMYNNGCEYCVMEVSAHAIALNKIDNINFDVVGLTNITNDHLDFFITMENYIKCKTSLFDCKHAKCGVVVADTTKKDLLKKSNIEITKIGKDGTIKIIACNTNANRTELTFSVNEKLYKLSTNLLGSYNIYNLLLALTCLNKLGFSMFDLVKAVNKIDFIVPGRFNFLDVKANFNVLVDYAHTPDGIKNVLKTVKELKPKRIITVFGCGGDRDKTKRPEMGKIASELSNLVIITSDNPRTENPQLIIDEIVAGITQNNFVTEPNRKVAINMALSMAKEGDVVAILGKGSETYMDINGVKIPFSDYQVVDDYFLKSRDTINI